MRKLLIIIFALIFLSCIKKTENKQVEKHQVSFQETGLNVTCTRAIKIFDNEIHGVCYLDNKGNQIDKDSIRNLLYSISLLDDFTQNNSRKYTTDQFELFEKNDNKVKIYKLMKTCVFIDNSNNLSNDKSVKSQLELQDFDLFLNDINKKISIRILNDDEVLKIKTDAIEIHRLSEDVPINLSKAIHKLDSIKENQNINFNR